MYTDTNPSIEATVDVGAQFATWFFWGFVTQTAMFVLPMILMCKKSSDGLKPLVLTFCGAVIGNLVWYILGMFLKWGAKGQACVESGYLLSANTLTSWFYDITLPLAGLVACILWFYWKEFNDYLFSSSNHVAEFK